MDKALKHICYKRVKRIETKLFKYLPFDLYEKIVMQLSLKNCQALVIVYNTFPMVNKLKLIIDKYFEQVNNIDLNIDIELINIVFNYVDNIKISLNCFLYKIFIININSLHEWRNLGVVSYYIYKYVKKNGLAEYDDTNVFKIDYVNNTIQPIIYALAIYALLLMNKNHLLIYKMLRYANNSTFCVLKYLTEKINRSMIRNLIGNPFNKKNISSNILYKSLLADLSYSINSFNPLTLSNIDNFDTHKNNIILLNNSYDLFLVRFYDYKCSLYLISDNNYDMVFKTIIDSFYVNLIVATKYNIESVLHFYKLDKSIKHYYNDYMSKHTNSYRYISLNVQTLTKYFNE